MRLKTFPAFWQHLIEPHSAIKDAGQRRQAQLLSSLLLFALFFGGIFAFGPFLFASISGTPSGVYTLSVLGTTIGWLVAYGLSRTPRYQIGSGLLIAALVIPTFADIINNPATPDRWVGSLTVIIIFSSIFLSARTTLALAILSSLGVLSLALLIPGFNELNAFYQLGIVDVSSLLLLVSIRHRNLVERDRQAVLAESEARYRQMFETNQAIKLLIDPKSRMIMDANQAACQFYGYSHAALLTMRIVELRAVSEYKQVTKMRRTTGLSQNYFAQRHRLASGEIRDVEVYSAPVDLSGQKLMYSIVHDVTDRRRAEQARRASEEQIRSLIASLDDWVYSIDLNGKILVYHQPAQSPLKLSGGANQTLIGKDYCEVLPEVLCQRLNYAINVVMTTHKMCLANYTHSLDGSERHFNVRVSPLMDAHQQPIGVTAIVRDVTVPVQAALRQQRLLEFEQFYRNITDLFAEINDPDRAISAVLAMAGEFMTLSRAHVFQFHEHEPLLENTHEWCAKTVTPIIHNLGSVAYTELLPSLVPTLTQDGMLIASQLNKLPPDMRTLLASLGIQAILITPLYVDGRLQGFTSFSQANRTREWLPEEMMALNTINQSYARSLENQRAKIALIQARDDALQSVRLKSEFVSNMSHEIRTPMTGVLGMLELLLETPINGEGKEFAESALRSAQNLLSLLDNILDFARIEAGKIVLEAKPISVHQIVAEVRETLLPQALKRNVEFYVEIDQNAPARVFGDPTRLRQILMNLANNALKFTHVGNICIRVRQVLVFGERSRLRFEVSDTGIGIAPEQLNSIFDSFVQGDGSTTRRYGGSGLGLAISQQLAQLMGGQIDVKSTVGKGSTFGFALTLPVADTDQQAVYRPDLQLVVLDADDTTRYLLCHQLRVWGLNILEETQPEKIIEVVLVLCQKEMFG